MDRRILRDWMCRYNAAGMAGLFNRKAPGRQPKLSEGQMAALKAQVFAGPDPGMDEAITLAEEFIGLVRGRASDRLDSWLNQAVRSTLRPMRNFAKHLSIDYEAVRAAVTLGWSSGPVEGQINRLKMMKRTMYGRAGLDLLERRFLAAA